MFRTKSPRRLTCGPRGPGLALVRREGQEVCIDLPDGQEIVVTLLDAARGRGRLHVVAPKNLNIRRGELPRRLDSIGRSAGPANTQQPAA